MFANYHPVIAIDATMNRVRITNNLVEVQDNHHHKLAVVNANAKINK